MGRVGRGWELAKVSLRVIRKDKILLLFPVLSGVFILLIMASFVAGIFFSVGFTAVTNGEANLLSIVLAFLFYLVSYFISIYFNAAIIGCAMIRLNGGTPTLSDGFRTSNENLGRLFGWALLAATVGMILRAIQERVGFIGKIIVGIIGVAWSIATYFAVPVLVFEKVGPWTAVKRSGSILRRTWGEAAIGNLGLGAIFLLAGLAGILPILLGGLLGGVIGLLVGLIVAFVYWVLLGVIASAAGAVLLAALYRYATTGKVGEDFANLPMFQAPAWRPIQPS